MVLSRGGSEEIQKGLKEISSICIWESVLPFPFSLKHECPSLIFLSVVEDRCDGAAVYGGIKDLQHCFF